MANEIRSYDDIVENNWNFGLDWRASASITFTLNLQYANISQFVSPELRGAFSTFALGGNIATTIVLGSVDVIDAAINGTASDVFIQTGGLGGAVGGGVLGGEAGFLFGVGMFGPVGGIIGGAIGGVAGAFLGEQGGSVLNSVYGFRPMRGLAVVTHGSVPRT